MRREATTVRVSSKGQIVIPIAFRRKLDLKTGQALTVRTTPQDEIVLSPADRDSAALDEMLRRVRAADKKLGGDPIRDLHERRRREREIEARKRERWGN